MVKNVLSLHFDSGVNQCSPVFPDFARSVQYDQDGKEYVSWKQVDYSEVQNSLGVVQDWSLESLVKAGINPEFPISTGYVNRLSGINDLQQLAVQVESVVESKND